MPSRAQSAARQLKYMSTSVDSHDNLIQILHLAGPAGFTIYCGPRPQFALDAVTFTGARRVCGPCPLSQQCLRHPERTRVRQVVFFTGRTQKPESHTERMKRRIDSEERRRRYGRRLAVVEPVFANIRHNKRWTASRYAAGRRSIAEVLSIGV